MMFRTSRLFAVSLVISCWASALGQELPPRDTLTSKYFPLSIGDRWLYAYEAKEVVFEVLRKETVNEGSIFVVRRTIEKNSVEFKVSVEDDGVYIHQDGAKKFSPPLRQFAFFARTGDSWKWKGTASGIEESQHFEHLGFEKVIVPAGEFSALKVHQSNPASAEFATFSLVKGVGVVQVSGKTEADTAGLRVTFDWKLKKVEFAAKK